MAELFAESAACAECCVNMSLLIREADARTADTHARTAALTLVGIDAYGSFALDVLKQSAGTTGDDDRRNGSFKLFL